MEPSVKKLIWIGALALILIWGTFFVLEFTATTPPHVAVTTIPSSPKKVQPLRQKKPVQKKVLPPKKLNKPIIPAPIDPVKVIPKINIPPMPEKKAPPPVPTPVLPKQKPPPERFVKLEKIYTSESRDAIWANDKEERIAELFKSGNLDRALVGVDCRYTLCKLEVKLEKSNSFLDLFKLPGLSAEISQESVTHVFGSNEDGTLVSYLARKGYKVNELIEKH